MAVGYYPHGFAFMNASHAHVCFECRNVAKGGYNRVCPTCQGSMQDMGKAFHAPKRRDDPGWRQARRLWLQMSEARTTRRENADRIAQGLPTQSYWHKREVRTLQDASGPQAKVDRS